MKESYAKENRLRYNVKRQFKKSTGLRGRQWKKYKKRMQRGGVLDKLISVFGIMNNEET